MGRLITTNVDKARVKSILPEWFKPEPGFRFLYGSGEAVVLGFGGYRREESAGAVTVHPKGRGMETYSITELTFVKPTLVIGYIYKGEWFISDVERIIHECEKDGKAANDFLFPIDHKFGDDRDDDRERAS